MVTTFETKPHYLKFTIEHEGRVLAVEQAKATRGSRSSMGHLVRLADGKQVYLPADLDGAEWEYLLPDTLAAVKEALPLAAIEPLWVALDKGHEEASNAAMKELCARLAARRTTND